jgi:hypothetical protein
MAHVKIRHLPDGDSKFQRSDFFVVAQSSGGQVTRKITADTFATKLFSAGTNVTINASGVISVPDKWQSQIDDINARLNAHTASADAEFKSLKSRLSTAESKITTLENKPALKHAFVDTTYTYFGQSSSISSSVSNAAKNLFSGLPKGSTLDVLWRRYWTYGTGNGSAAAERHYLTRYTKTADSNSWTTSWTNQVSIGKFKSGRDSYGSY